SSKYETIFVKRSRSPLQGDAGVHYRETHALIVALRAAAGESGGGGQIAALGERFVEARGDQFAMQTGAAVRRNRAVRKERGQAAVTRRGAAAGQLSALGHGQIAQGPGHGTDGAADVHLFRRQFVLLEEAPAHRVAPHVGLVGQRAAHARREDNGGAGQPFDQHVVEFRHAVPAAAQRGENPGVGQRAEFDRDLAATAPEKRLQPVDLRLRDRAVEPDGHRVAERRLRRSRRPQRAWRPPHGWRCSRARWPLRLLQYAAPTVDRKKPRIPPDPVCRMAHHNRYGGTNPENERRRNDLRQLLAQRGAETLGHARRDQGHGGPGQCQRNRGIRRGCGEAGDPSQRSPATRLRSPGMKTTAPERVDLPVSGMTCAACARTIERTLANTPGVRRANVNLATNTATVEFDPGIVQVRDFVSAIEELGYGVPEKAAPADAAEQGYRRRLIVAAIFAAPVLVLGMSHGMLHVPYSPWIQLALTLPVIFYAGAPFYLAAWSALRHGAANMNSLIALGTGAAFLYSLVETLRGRHEVYYEAAAVIIALILLGRTLEARARGQAGEAIRRLMDLQPPGGRGVRGGAGVETAVE